MNILCVKFIAELKSLLLLAIVLFTMQNTMVVAQPREVKIGAASMEGTLNFSASLATKINDSALIIAEAGKLDLDLVVLPEAYFKGSSYSNNAQNLSNSVLLDSMKTRAKQHSINIIFQTFEIGQSQNTLYNTAVVINRDGEYVGKYRKVNLPPEEVGNISPGDSYPVFDLDFGKVGVLICWDGWFTEPSRILKENGAEIIVIPTWSNCPKNMETITAENGLPICYSVLKVPRNVPWENIPSSLFDAMGNPVYENHAVGSNNIAYGTVNLGNYTNLALNKNVTASSEIDGAHPVSNVVDGIYSTERDASLELQSSWKADSMPQWIEIDLGNDCEINQVVIAHLDGEDYRYVIEGKESGGEYGQLSDAVTKYETILEHGILGSELFSSRFDKTKARYVRVHLNSYSETSISINEIKVFGYLEPEVQAGNEYYVSPNGSFYNEGTEVSPWNIERANNALLPGETAIFMDGTYTNTPIAPANSGTEGAYITYRAANKHMAVFENINEVPNSRGPVAIFVNDKSYIDVAGIKVLNVKRWVMGERSHHITIENGHFENGSGWINCRFDEIGDGMRILNNHFTGGTDLVSLDGGSGHLVEGNFFGDASHTGLVLLGVKNSVVRNNYMTNRLWRNMEVESQRHEPYNLSMYNLIEKNIFDYSPCKDIQYAGNNSIIRKNIFRRSLEGMGWANYLGRDKTPEAWHDEHNRFYNNVIAECGSNEIVLQIIKENEAQGINVAESVSNEGYGMTYSTNLFNPPIAGYNDCAYGDNILVNNIFYKNKNTKQSKSSNNAQIAFDWNATPEFGRYYSNNIYSGEEGAEVIYFLDGPYQNPALPRNFSVQSFEEQYPDWASNNFEVDPQFIDSETGNYELNESSPCIDKGQALTKTTSAGEGTVIYVEDALYFTDGYGIVEADIIRINGERVNIVNVDYESNSIIIEQNISWQQGDGIYSDYEGNAPDLGAFEYGISTGVDEQHKFGAVESFKLLQNYPNPFNPSTMIEYSLNERANVRLEVFDTLGRRLITLVNENKPAGAHRSFWNAKNEIGDNVSSGMYFYRINVTGNNVNGSEVKKMVLLR